MGSFAVKTGCSALQSGPENLTSIVSDDLQNGVLIPGLPNHVSVLCLLKVPRLYHLNLAGVSSLWRKVVRGSSFYEKRRKIGNTDAWLVVVSAEPLARTGPLMYTTYDLQSRQLLFQVKFPPFRRSSLFRGSAPDRFRIAAFDEYFVLLGWGLSGEKHFVIYNTVTNEWRNSALIGASRYQFACGVIDENLYIAGGFNSCGKLERSTEVYNFNANKWRKAARMPDELDHIDADVVFQKKLYVRCWGSKCKQKTLWEYDPVNDEWVQEARLSSNMPKEGNLVATDSFMYALDLDKGELHRFERNSAEWKLVRNQPWKIASKTNIFNARSQRAFGYGDREICFLSGFSSSHHQIFSAKEYRCHRLFMTNSTYCCAGTIVRA